MCVYWHMHACVCMHTIFERCERCSVWGGRRVQPGIPWKKVLSVCIFHLPLSSYSFHFLSNSLCNSEVERQAKDHIHMHERLFEAQIFFPPNLNDEDCNRKRRKHFSSAELPSSAKILWAFVTSYMLMPAVPEGTEVCQTLPLIWTCGTSSCFSKGMSHRQNSLFLLLLRKRLREEMAVTLQSFT